MKKFKLLLILIFLGMLFFQNCGRIIVEPLPIVETQPIAKLNFKAQSCVDLVNLNPQKTKFIFVIDLSRSNIGTFEKGRLESDDSTAPLEAFFFTTRTATDPNGRRFQALKNFIQNCAGTNDVEFSVIGFSKSAGTLVKDTNSTNQVLSCDSKFVSSTEAIARIDHMKNTQDSETAVYNQFQAPSKPFTEEPVRNLIYKETNYIAASDCLGQTLQADLKSQNSAVNYQVFFLSDGRPESEESGCDKLSESERVNCYKDKIEPPIIYSNQLAASISKSIRIHTLFYSQNGESNSQIETYLQLISNIGGTQKPVNIGSFENNQSTTNENPFCRLISIENSKIFQTNSIFAINTTVIKKGEKYFKDSDSDGLTDEEEIRLGSDPLVSRSKVNDILDGACLKFANFEDCKDKRQVLTCNPTEKNSFGLNDCEIKILKLSAADANIGLIGIDTDLDGIPDYVELIKGLNPNFNDSQSDPDRDGLSNIQEISLGLDPFTADNSPKNILTQKSEFFNDKIASCSTGGWDFYLNSIPAITEINNFLIYYRFSSLNFSEADQFKLIRKKIQIRPTSEESKVWSVLNDSSFVIMPSDFRTALNIDQSISNGGNN